jgi:hypothetical protein
MGYFVVILISGEALNNPAPSSTTTYSVEALLVGVNINKPISFVTVVVPCDHLFLDLRVYFGSFLI